MVKSAFNKSFRIVDFFVQTDHGGHLVQLEVGKVGFGGMQRVAVINFGLCVGSTKG